jgi:predicted dehydrogenase
MQFAPPRRLSAIRLFAMKVRWGILGCGSIATSAVAPAIRWSSNSELVAIGSRDAATARARAEAVAAPRAHASYAALLADEAVDAVYIGLPNGLHEEWALRACEAGKHVLCEKSLTLTSGGARRVAAAFRARGLRLVEGFMYRHHPQWDVVRKLLADHAIGDVRILRAGIGGMIKNDADHRFSPTLGGGALFDSTCYAVDVARMLLSAEPRRVTALAVPVAPGGVSATCSAVLEFPGGVLTTAHGSLRSARDQFLTILGTRGRIDVERPFIPEWSPTQIRVERDDESRILAVGGANHFLHQVEHFASLVIDPRRAAYPAEDGVANVTVCEAIARSCASGQAVDLAATQ